MEFCMKNLETISIIYPGYDSFCWFLFWAAYGQEMGPKKLAHQVEPLGQLLSRNNGFDFFWMSPPKYDVFAFYVFITISEF